MKPPNICMSGLQDVDISKVELLEKSLPMTIPPSPTATSTSTMPSNSGSIDFIFSGDSTASSSHHDECTMLDPFKPLHHKTSNPSLLLPPSPSRSTLDPEYANRLFTSKYSRHIERDAMSLSPPRIHRIGNSPSPQGGMFGNPEISLSSDSRDDVEGTAINSNSIRFETPERSVNTPVFNLSNRPPSSLESISPIIVPRLTPQASPITTSSSQYHTPKNSPRRVVNGIRNLGSNPATIRLSSIGNHARVRSSLNKSPNITGSNLSVINRRTSSADRFIPSRAFSNLNFSVWNSPEGNSAMDGDAAGSHEEASPLGAMASGTTNGPTVSEGRPATSPTEATSVSRHSQYQSQQPPLLNALLRSELLGENIDPTPVSPTLQNRSSEPGYHNHQGESDILSMHHSPRQQNRTPLREGRNFLRFYQKSRQTVLDELHGGVSLEDPTSTLNSLSLSPVGMASSNRLSSIPQKCNRRIAKVPFKVLDAPDLADDFYLNLVDWSQQNILAVGLGSCVYLWNACTSNVTKLCDLGPNTRDAVTSVSWAHRGLHLAVGAHNGEVQIWDTIKCQKVRTMLGHSGRIGALSWSGPTLASGGRDRLIYLRDVRSQQPFMTRLEAHRREVCGLKWSFGEPAHLASGGNDNKLLVWDIKFQRKPVHKFSEHTAAVKAIAWSPHQHGLLASGGGTSDRCIRFWNALSGSAINAVDTGSQVCNLAWSQNCNELVSTHGYSLNQIIIWKYPTMQKVATLTGHTNRVLYLSTSPDGSTIVTGTGDETLRFWQVFPGPRSSNKISRNGLLFPSNLGSTLR